MPFDWKALIDLAKQMEAQATQTSEPDALQRSAISRAYFGAFGHACNYAKEFLGFDPNENADDHGRLRAHLKARRRHGDAKRLERLRQWRNDADYLNDLPWADVDVTVTAAIREAESVVNSLSPPKTP